MVTPFDHRKPHTIYAIDENLAKHLVLRKIHGVERATARQKEMPECEATRLFPWSARLDDTSWAFHAPHYHAAYEKALRAVKGRPTVVRIDEFAVLIAMEDRLLERCARMIWPESVSYTHLTLPTTPYV